MKKPKVPKRVTVEDEEIFRNNDDLRKELAGVLDSQIFRMALHIYFSKRIEIEALTESLALGSTELVSVRMNSQRIGVEGFLAYLRELTKPLPPEPQQEQAAAFGADQAAQELLKRGIAI